MLGSIRCKWQRGPQQCCNQSSREIFSTAPRQERGIGRNDTHLIISVPALYSMA